MAGQLAPFATVGVVCTLLYVVGFNLLRSPLGAWPANVVALTATMVLNTAANRRYTFGRRGRQDLGRHYVEAGASTSSASSCRRSPSAWSRSWWPRRRRLRADTGPPGRRRGRHRRALRGPRSWVFHPGRAADERRSSCRSALRSVSDAGPTIAAADAAAAAGAPPCAAASTTPRGYAPRCSASSSPPACCTSGASARRAGPTRSTRRRCRRARRAGRRSSSARSTPPTPSPSTSRRRRCGSCPCRLGCSV